MDKNEFKNLLDAREDLQSDLFIRGFLITDDKNIDDKVFPFYGNWNKSQQGKFIFYSHKLTGVFTYTDNDGNTIDYQTYIANGGNKVDYWDTPIPGIGYNPEYAMEMMKGVTKDYSTASSGYITLEPIKNLKITSRGGLEFIYRDYNYLRSPEYAGNVGNGYAQRSARQYLTGTVTNTAEYMFDIKDDHSFTVLAGQEGVGYNYDYFAAAASGIESSDLTHLQFGTQSTYSVASNKEAYTNLSYFGRLDYSYKDFLYVDASVRNDRTSRFNEKNRSGVFWAVGAMVNLKNLLLKDNQTITALTAKVSYGTQGNQSVGDYYPYQGTYGAVSEYDGSIGYGVASASNPILTWETQTKFTAAAHITLWNRLNIDAEYYIRNTHDMLMSVPQPSTTGVSYITENVGAMSNKGVDLSINYDIFRTSDYRLNVGLNFNYNQQKITELFDGRDTWTIANTGISYVVGQAVSYYYPIFAGVNSQTGLMEWYLPGSDFTQTTTSETTTTFNADDLNQYTGKQRYAPIAGGFSIGGGWKGLSLQADFNYVLGKWMVNNDTYFSQNPDGFFGYNTSQNVTDYWKETGDVALYPNWNGLVYDPSTGSYTTNGDNTVMQFDTHLLENASFMRLKNLTVAYQFPTKWFETQNVVSGLKLYATGRNLFTVTKYTGVDPEVDSNLSTGAYPSSRQFILGVELTF